MMQIPTASPPIPAHAYSDRAKRHKDGSVLLSIADDRICKLNGVGALTWMILEENPKGLSVDEVVRELGEQFEAINSQGELLYEVSHDRLRDDTARFLKNIARMNLLETRRDSCGEESYCIKEGVSGTTTAPIAAAAEDKTALTPLRVSTDEDAKPIKRETLTAFIGLLFFDLVLKFRGFQSLIKRVERWPTAAPHTRNREMCRRVRAMVDRAQMYYPKKAMCLQHSAVVTCLLRRRGIPAQLVLAAQEFPPKGHAWTEVDGEVVNDKASVKRDYVVLRRV